MRDWIAGAMLVLGTLLVLAGAAAVVSKALGPTPAADPAAPTQEVPTQGPSARVFGAVRRMPAADLPVAAGDATALPVADACVPAVTCLLAHTDVPDYAAVVREAARVLRGGGRFVHVGVHPCFTGAFADRTDRARIVVDSGYHRTGR